MVGKGNIVREEQIEEDLKIMFSGYRSRLDQDIEEDAWMTHLNELDDN